MVETGEANSLSEEEFEKLRDKLTARLQAAIKRRGGKIRKLQQALAEMQNEETYRRYGELVKANLAKIKRGRKKVKVVDYYSEDQREIVIELAPEKNPRQNMEAFFKRARKLRSGRPRVQKEMKVTQEEIESLENLAARVRDAAPEHIEDLDAEVDAALAPRKMKKPKGVPKSKLGPKSFVSSDGYEILVGRNQRQNDKLTLAIARGSDIFMHAGGSPGSHIIIRARGAGDPPGRAISVPRKTMLEAANLAVYYSKMRNSGYAEVSWTHVKNVSKPRSAKPGLVYLSKHKTLGIEPDAELVKMLHKRGG